METIKKYWFVLVVIALALAVYVGVKKGLISLFDAKSPETKLAEEQISSISIDDKKLTINKYQAVLISQQLWVGMDMWGTDEGILDLLEPLNSNDLLFVIKTFGIKPYSGEGAPDFIDSKISNYKSLNLVGWLKEELSGEDLERAKTIFMRNNIPF